jgi:hypothetical protein
MPDYFIAYQLTDDAFKESLGLSKRYTDKRISVIERKGPITPRKLANILGLNVSTLTRWIKERVEKGLLVWCGKDGKEFGDDNSLNRAKHAGDAHIRVSHPVGLPSSFQLTGDSRWDVGGEFYREYDLGIDDPFDGDESAEDTKEDTTDYPDEKVEDLYDSPKPSDSSRDQKGVGVFDGNVGVEKNISVESNAQEGFADDLTSELDRIMLHSGRINFDESPGDDLTDSADESLPDGVLEI